MPVREDARCVDRLKAVFAQRGYLGAEATAALGGAAGQTHRRVDLPLYLRRLATPEPLHVLVRLFGLLVPVGEADARAALAPLTPEELAEAGLIERRDGQLRAVAALTAFEGLLLAHDPIDDGSGRLAADHVLGVNPTTINLAQLTIRRRVRSALDLGCVSLS